MAKICEKVPYALQRLDASSPVSNTAQTVLRQSLDLPGLELNRPSHPDGTCIWIRRKREMQPSGGPRRHVDQQIDACKTTRTKNGTTGGITCSFYGLGGNVKLT